MKPQEFKKLIREEIRQVIKESIYVGQTVKVKTPGMAHYNKIGEVVEQDSQKKFFTVEFPAKGNQVELAYYHVSDLKAILPQEGVVKESHDNQQNYMFFQNLHTMKSMIEKMLELNTEQVDQLLSDGHAWAVDHISTSTDDVTEVGQWLCNELSNTGTELKVSKSVTESFMSELDVIRQESSSLQDFIKRVKQSFPKLTKVAGIDDTLKDLWNASETIK